MKGERQVLVVAAMIAATSACAGVARAQQPADVGGRMARADAAYSAGERDAAERGYASVIAADSAQSRAVFRLAQLVAGRDRAASLALYRRYVMLEPRDPWGHIALGDALGASGDLSAALAAYDSAARLAPGERDVRVGRARLLARAGHVDASIDAYEGWVAQSPADTEAWRELATQRRRAGRYVEAVAALERVQAPEAATRSAVARDITRLRALARGTIEPLVGGSRDADGLTTMRTGVTVTSPLLGRTRIFAVGSAERAGDGTVARASQDGMVGLQLRPLAQLRLELAGGVSRADRSVIDTTGLVLPGRRGAGGASHETIPTGRARLVWRTPGDALGVDARAARLLLDASPLLVSRGVLRDEASLSLDARLAGPLRVRGFGREGSVHNEAESNGRHTLGGALAYAPGPWEVSLRGQTMRYDHATTLPYFAPRYVRTAELTTYLERETSGGATIALDLGGGAQQVAEWTSSAASWSPSFRGWTQVIVPLGGSLALGTELEAYDSRIGSFTPTTTASAAQWWYGSLSTWLRVAF